MSAPPKTFSWTLAIGLLLVAMTLALLFLLAQLRVGTAPHPPGLPVYSQVGDFTLTNQAGDAVSLADWDGRVWIADIIFTRCPGPCVRMTRQMKELELALTNTGVKLVSLTTDPVFDTPQILAKYAGRFGADTSRWSFLTGTPTQIADLAVGSLKLALVEKKTAERESADDLFIHSTILVLVDKHGRVRGVYETGGEGVDWSKSKQDLLAAAGQLERER